MSPVKSHADIMAEVAEGKWRKRRRPRCEGGSDRVNESVGREGKLYLAGDLSKTHDKPLKLKYCDSKLTSCTVTDNKKPKYCDCK